MSQYLLPFLSLIVGITLLYAGAELLVRCSSAVALRFGARPLVVGLTIVAFGTSSPELVVSLKAALAGNDSIALGNVVGSNVANVGLILGISALLCPLRTTLQVIRKDLPIMIGVSLLIGVLLWDGKLGRLEGVFLTAGLLAYAVFTLIMARVEGVSKMDKAPEIIPQASQRSQWSQWLGILGGLGLLAAGSHLLVEGAIAIARMAGLSEALIGLTIVALGTSLPELATSALAAAKGEADLAVGNVVGSNIFNLLGILGISATVTPLSSVGIGYIDFAVMIFLSVLLLPLLRTGFRLERWEGCLMLAIYVGYMVYLIQ